MAVQAPRLEVQDLDFEPFSNTFSGLFGGLPFDLNDQHPLDLDRATYETSYNTHNYTNLSVWDDDDIEEIMMIMPNKFPSTLSTIPEDLEPTLSNTHPPALSDFEILQPPQVTRKLITTTHCRNRSTGKLFTLKSKPVDSQAVSRWSEQLFLEYMRDFPSTQVRTAFIPYLHAVFQEGEQMYLVLDPEPTLTLRGLVSRHDGFLAAEVVLFYASEIAMAISTLHSAGVMHRDLSPSNVMIDGEGHILLTCLECAEFFGPSRNFLSGNRLMAESESKDYHAPEILLGWGHDSTVDCWGFGMLLYFMLLGTHPFDVVEADDHQLLKDKILQGSIPSDMLCTVEFRARDLTLKCLERNPVGRPDIERIKEHPYFSRTSWELVASKRSEVPIVPQSNSGRTINETNTLKRAASLTPFRSTVLYSDPSLVDWKTRTIIPQLPEIFQSSMSILPIHENDSFSPLPAVDGQASYVEDAGLDEEEGTEANSIERRARFWDAFDRELEGSLDANRNVDRGSAISVNVISGPTKLRRQKSLIYPQQLIASLSTTSLQIQHKLRKRRMAKSKTKSTSALRRQDLQELDLPVGIEQIGSGIGFTYNLPVVTVSSKASICTSVPRTCYGRALQQLGLGVGLGFDNGNRSIKRHGHGCAKRTSKIRAREGGQRQEGKKLEDSGSRQQKDLSSREKQRDLNTVEQQDSDSREQQDSKSTQQGSKPGQQQDSKSNPTRRFLKEMYRCPSWILSTPFGVPSPLALTVANSGNEAANVGFSGNLDPASDILLDIAAPTPADGVSVHSILTWDSTWDGDLHLDATSPVANLDAASSGSSSDATSPRPGSDAASPGSSSNVSSPGSSSDPTSPACLSQNSDDDTGPFTPMTIVCAEEASVPKSVELAVDGDGHMDVVDVESTLRLVTSSGLRLSFLSA